MVDKERIDISGGDSLSIPCNDREEEEEEEEEELHPLFSATIKVILEQP